MMRLKDLSCPAEHDNETCRGAEDEPMEVLRLAARLIMENGGESFRVEETISRMGKCFGLEEVECFAAPSGIFFSYKKPSGQTETAILRVRVKETDLNRVDQVNHVSRDLAEGRIAPSEAMGLLREIEQQPTVFPYWLVCLAVGITALGFTMMFQGNLADCLIALVITSLVWAGNRLLQKIRISGNAPTLLNSFLNTFLVLILCRLTGLGNTATIIPGVLMPLVPGLAMTSGVQDTVRGDMLSGLSHGIQAILTAVLIAAGVLTATTLVNYILPLGGA